MALAVPATSAGFTFHPDCTRYQARTPNTRRACGNSGSAGVNCPGSNFAAQSFSVKMPTKFHHRGPVHLIGRKRKQAETSGQHDPRSQRPSEYLASDIARAARPRGQATIELQRLPANGRVQNTARNVAGPYPNCPPAVTSPIGIQEALHGTPRCVSEQLEPQPPGSMLARKAGPRLRAAHLAIRDFPTEPGGESPGQNADNRIQDAFDNQTCSSEEFERPAGV